MSRVWLISGICCNELEEDLIVDFKSLLSLENPMDHLSDLILTVLEIRHDDLIRFTMLKTPNVGIVDVSQLYQIDKIDIAAMDKPPQLRLKRLPREQINYTSRNIEELYNDGQYSPFYIKFDE